MVGKSDDENDESMNIGRCSPIPDDEVESIYME